jgi:hypothetical protein
MTTASAGQSEASAENITVSYWLDPRDGDAELVVQLSGAGEDPAVSAGRPLVVNLQQTGYYRVNYDAENWDLLAGFLASGHVTEIHRSSRAQAAVSPA